MHIAIAPNAFKGSLSAEEAAECIAAGIRESKLKCDLTLFPIADGGDDTATLLNKKWNAQIIAVKVHDPLGRLTNASFGWIQKEKKAIIALSDASGIKLLNKDELNSLHTSTFGTGEMIKAALDKEAEKVIIGAGGSATVDGGSGLLRALGLSYSDDARNEISDLPLGLEKLKVIHTTGLDKRLLKTEITVLCDVRNKLLGDQGSAKIFGPQKGAGKKEIIILEQCLKQWNHKTTETIHVDMNELKYGGAAGGVAAGLAAYTGARLVSGITYFLHELKFDDLLKNVDLVITGEGRIDEQTIEGKGPLGVALMAKEKNIPVIGMAGQINIQSGSKLTTCFSALIPVNPSGATLKKAIKHTPDNLRRAAWEWGKAQSGY